MDPVTLLAVIGVTGVGATASGAVAAAGEWLGRVLFHREKLVQADETLEARMAELGKTMSGAAELMVLVEAEIKARQEEATKLAAEVKQQEELATLTKEAKEAVAAVLHAELAREGRKAKWQAFWFGFAFFAFGSS